MAQLAIKHPIHKGDGVLKAILWDNDGVMVDTEELYFKAGQEVLATMGVSLTRDMFIEQSLKKGKSVFDLLPANDQANIDRLRKNRNARYTTMLETGVKVIDGVEDVLKTLHGRVRMGVVTGSRREHFQVIHKQTNLLRFFEFTVVRENYERSKPHPDGYLTAMKLHRLTPDECIVIEDSERGVRAAADAGLRVFVVPHELTQHGDFSPAYKMLTSVRDIVAEVEKLMGE